jgi:hypothetical protein
MSAYDHNFSVLAIDGYRITGFVDAADSIAFNYPNGEGTITYGAQAGQYAFVASGNGKAVQLVFKLLQGHEDNKFMLERLKSQRNLRNHTPLTCSYQNIVSGDTITATDGWIVTRAGYVRGTAHNDGTWTIEFVNENSDYTGK